MSDPNGQPRRRTVPLPSTGDLPRVGKVRLGVKVEGTSKAGESFTRPKATDYFVVTADDSGVTNPESAESFIDLYGNEPRVISCVLPASTPDQVMEGAWRLYGTGKLKRKCDGVECDERTPTGGWVTKPCVCRADGIPETKDNGQKNALHCRLIWTLNVLLPGVQGVGVWQVETQSEISARRVANWLAMMADLVGDLRMVPFELHLVPVSVAPDGKSKTVYVLEPRATAQTQMLIQPGERRRMLEAGPAEPEPGPVVPAPAADEDDADYSYDDPDDPVNQDPGREEERPSEPEAPLPDGGPVSTGIGRLDELKAMPLRLQASNPEMYQEAHMSVIRQAVIADGIEWKTRALEDDATWARVKAIAEACCVRDAGQQTIGGV